MKRALLFSASLLIACPVFADFNPSYDEAVVLSTMEPNIDAGIYECSVPVTSYMTHVYVNGRNYYTQQITDWSVEDMPCITHIVYKDEDSANVEALDGYLGRGHDVVNTKEYQSVVTKTIGEMNTYIDDEGKAVAYTGEDADDPWPVWVFLQKDYVQ